MLKFLRIASKLFACLAIVVVPVIKALITALDSYANTEAAYATV